MSHFKSSDLDRDALRSRAPFPRPFSLRRAMNAVSASTVAAARHRAAYRTRARRSEVDESLFGAAHKIGAHQRSAPNQTTTRVAHPTHSPSRCTAFPGGCASTLSTSDLDQMRTMASDDDSYEHRQRIARQHADEREAAAERAHARRSKMRALELERQRQLAPSELEVENAHSKAAILSDAERQRCEALDDVKQMNRMCLYAQVVTIRDAQVPHPHPTPPHPPPNPPNPNPTPTPTPTDTPTPTPTATHTPTHTHRCSSGR